jgi:hypothetical protein
LLYWLYWLYLRCNGTNTDADLRNNAERGERGVLLAREQREARLGEHARVALLLCQRSLGACHAAPQASVSVLLY